MEENILLSFFAKEKSIYVALCNDYNCNHTSYYIIISYEKVEN